MNNKDIKINLDIEDFINCACQTFNINNEIEIIQKIELFKENFKIILERKFENIAMYLSIYEFDVQIKWRYVSYLNLYKRDEMLVHFNMILSINGIAIGEIENLNKFTLHKYNILDISKDENGFVSSKGDLIDKEPDLLNRLQAMSPEDFELSGTVIEHINDLGFINDCYVNDNALILMNQYKVFSYVLLKLLIKLTNEDIYDFNKIGYIKFKYVISSDEKFNIEFVMSDRYGIVESIISNINYRNEEEFNLIVLNIFCQALILNPEILKNSDYKDYKEIFKMSRLLDY